MTTGKSLFHKNYLQNKAITLLLEVCWVNLLKTRGSHNIIRRIWYCVSKRVNGVENMSRISKKEQRIFGKKISSKTKFQGIIKQSPMRSKSTLSPMATATGISKSTLLDALKRGWI